MKRSVVSGVSCGTRAVAAGAVQVGGGLARRTHARLRAPQLHSAVAGSEERERRVYGDFLSGLCNFHVNLKLLQNKNDIWWSKVPTSSVTVRLRRSAVHFLEG